MPKIKILFLSIFLCSVSSGGCCLAPKPNLSVPFEIQHSDAVYIHEGKITNVAGRDYVMIRGTVSKHFGNPTRRIKVEYMDQGEKVLVEEEIDVQFSRVRHQRNSPAHFSIKASYSPEIKKCRLSINN